MNNLGAVAFSRMRFKACHFWPVSSAYFSLQDKILFIPLFNNLHITFYYNTATHSTMGNKVKKS